jgi:hypothetical protein
MQEERKYGLEELGKMVNNAIKGGGSYGHHAAQVHRVVLVTGDHKASGERAIRAGSCDGMQNIAELLGYGSSCPESFHAVCNGGAVSTHAPPRGPPLRREYRHGNISDIPTGMVHCQLIF